MVVSSKRTRAARPIGDTAYRSPGRCLYVAVAVLAYLAWAWLCGWAWQQPGVDGTVPLAGVALGSLILKDGVRRIWQAPLSTRREP